MSFDDIKAGDRVIVNSRVCLRVAMVDRVTKTQIVIGNSRYRRKDGNQVGGSEWGAEFLQRAEGEALKDAEREAKAWEAAALMQKWGFRALCKLGDAELTALLDALRAASRTLLKEAA